MGQGLVSIRRADLCLVELNPAGGAASNGAVSIRRADLCLVEDRTTPRTMSECPRFQSAVRISVWLKDALMVLARDRGKFQSAVRISVWLKALCPLRLVAR